MATGRPKKEIDKKIFENLCGLQCTLFAEVYKKHSAKGKTSLRRIQFKLAEKSAAMAIFLGRNYLGQKNNDIETDEQTLQAVGEALVKIKRAAEQAENNE